MYICTYAHTQTRYLGAGEAEPVRGSVNAPYHMHNTMNHMQNKTQCDISHPQGSLKELQGKQGNASVQQTLFSLCFSNMGGAKVEKA